MEENNETAMGKQSHPQLSTSTKGCSASAAQPLSSPALLPQLAGCSGGGAGQGAPSASGSANSAPPRESAAFVPAQLP